MRRRDLYLSALCDGLTGREVAAKFGVRPQTVSMLTTGLDAHRERNAEYMRRKRGSTRRVTCALCHCSGHNSRTCGDR